MFEKFSQRVQMKYRPHGERKRDRKSEQLMSVLSIQAMNEWFVFIR